MYHIPTGKIAFQHVAEFCQEDQDESLILDYKSDWPADLNKVLCGMANVQGGMVLVGVGARPGTRKPAWPPVGVTGTDDELNQKAVQIAYDAIYPPVLPQIDVVRLDDDPARAVVVIRVEASRILHTVDQRRRVVVRVFDHTRGVSNDLASIAQLEWLFQQRAGSEKLREYLLERAGSRANDVLDARRGLASYEGRTAVLALSASPSFPSRRPSRTPADVREIARGMGRHTAAAKYSSFRIPHDGDWRTTAEGAFVLPPSGRGSPQYVELGAHGTVFLEHVLPTHMVDDPHSDIPVEALGAYTVLAACDCFISFAATFYERSRLHGPVRLMAELRDTKGTWLDHRLPEAWRDPHGLVPNTFAQDELVELHDDEHSIQSLKAVRRNILQGITYNLLWSYGFSDTQEGLDAYFARIMAWPAE